MENLSGTGFNFLPWAHLVAGVGGGGGGGGGWREGVAEWDSITGCKSTKRLTAKTASDASTHQSVELFGCV